MSVIKPIRSEEDFDAALDRIELLMDASTQSELDELDILSTLVEKYEADNTEPIALPDPIDAILFRMEQQKLKRSDMRPYLGGSSKVSEVLTRKRPLTLKMIRALHTHLGIPANVLIGEPNAVIPENASLVQWDKFPIFEMSKNGWLPNFADIRDRAEEVMRDLIDRAGGDANLSVALYRKNDSARRNASMDPYALQAWCLHVLSTARDKKLEEKYIPGTIDRCFLRQVAKLSEFSEGPLLAKELLEKNGIAFVYAPHLKKTYLDGAAMQTKEGVPIVALTLRYDRLDNFWFCLLHELAHVGWHLGDEVDHFIDDLSLKKADHSEDWDLEDEADELASDSLIPEEIWRKYNFPKAASPLKIVTAAREASVHPAVIAGRVRKETENYRLLSQFVGSGEVRKLFDSL